MGLKKRIRENRRVVYAQNMDRPEDLLHFVHFPFFVRRWNALGFDDEDLRALETLIMASPARAPVVAGTGGLRKLRFARSDGNKGARSGVRIGYVCVPEFHAVGLAAVYSKNEQGDLTHDQRKFIREGIQRFKIWLANTEGKRSPDRNQA